MSLRDVRITPPNNDDSNLDHAQVPRVEDDADPLRLQELGQTRRDLFREPFLVLQAAGELMDQARSLRQADDPPRRHASAE